MIIAKQLKFRVAMRVKFSVEKYTVMKRIKFPTGKFRNELFSSRG